MMLQTIGWALVHSVWQAAALADLQRMAAGTLY